MGAARAFCPLVSFSSTLPISLDGGVGVGVGGTGSFPDLPQADSTNVREARATHVSPFLICLFFLND